MIDFLEKTPYEEFPITGDYESVISEGEVLLNTSFVIIKDEDNADVTSTMLPDPYIIDGAFLVVLIVGGTKGAKYNLNFIAKTSLGNTWDVPVLVTIS